MKAERWHHATACGGCGLTIQAHEPVYLVTAKRLARCERCSRTLLIGPLPEVPPIIEAPLPYLTEADQALGRRMRETIRQARFPKAAVAKKVRENILDWRARQAGDQS